MNQNHENEFTFLQFAFRHPVILKCHYDKRQYLKEVVFSFVQRSKQKILKINKKSHHESQSNALISICHQQCSWLLFSSQGKVRVIK